MLKGAYVSGFVLDTIQRNSTGSLTSDILEIEAEMNPANQRNWI